MPRIIECTDERTLTLEDCVEAIASAGFDPAEAASVDHGALCLRRLGNDRSFLGDMLIDQLKASGSDDMPDSAYGAQATSELTRVVFTDIISCTADMSIIVIKIININTYCQMYIQIFVCHSLIFVRA